MKTADHGIKGPGFFIRALVACMLVCLLFFVPFAGAHTYTISVVVDTDLALDDMRALIMLLNSGTADIPLIVTSDGASSPEVGCRNAAILLKHFNQEGTVVAKGRELGRPAPPWRSWSEDVPWADAADLPKQYGDCRPAGAAIVSILRRSEGDTVYLCLGPLTNLAEALSISPDIEHKISRLIYYGGHPDAPSPGWNTDRDKDSARVVFGSSIPIYTLDLPKEKLLCFDQDLMVQIGANGTAAAKLVRSFYETATAKRLLAEGHFFVWDELPVIYLNRPSLFTFVPSSKHDHVMTLTDYRVDEVRETYVTLFGPFADMHLSPRHAVTLKNFPVDPVLFRDDIRVHVSDIIEKHGLEEWKACLLTNELHRHLGAYSLIGAKMGIRAREILEAPFDALRVVSFAGNHPPLSCMNDGLQVSTGASLGRGTISISEETSSPSATFSYRDRKITLKIKDEIVAHIKADIKAAIAIYGGLNPGYFAQIRKVAIRYWRDLDRKQIFDEYTEPAGNEHP